MTTETYRVLILSSSWDDLLNTPQGFLGPKHDMPSTLAKLRESADTSVLALGGQTAQAQETLGLEDKVRQATQTLNGLELDAVALNDAQFAAKAAEERETLIRSLHNAEISTFGYGQSIAEAQTPLVVPVPARSGGGEIHLHAMLQRRKGQRSTTGIYANEEAAGSVPLDISSAPYSRNVNTAEDTFQIALPAWGDTGTWRNNRQFALAHRLLKKDYDLVLGYGTGAAQEILRKQHRWVAYGLGNGLCSSGGPSPTAPVSDSAPDVSLWAMLEVHSTDEQRWMELKLYPVSSPAGSVSASPAPLTTAEFTDFLEILRSRPIRPWRFSNDAMTTGENEFGHFISLSLGDWPIGSRPVGLNPPREEAEPGDWPLRSPSPVIDDKILGLNKQFGAAMMALAAEDEGAKVHWVHRDLSLTEIGDKRLLTFRYRAHESSLGAALVHDKVLAARVLERAGVPTPKTILVKSPDEAVSAANTISGPVVVKPRDGVKSLGVSTDLKDDEEVREAFAFARAQSAQVIVQPHISFSEELRVMASDKHAVAVNGRALPHVIGDGSSTIGQLIADKNLQRALNPSLDRRPIPVDALTERQLTKLQLSLDSVPEYGEAVTVRGVAGLSVGGDTIQALDDTPEEIKQAAVNAVAAVPGLGWGGVDIIIEEGTGRPYVIEINTQAAYGAALFPAYGTPKDVGSAAWQARIDSTSAETDVPPQTAQPCAEPIPVLQHRVPTSGKKSVTFSSLFRNYLTRSGMKWRRPNIKVRRVQTPSGWVWVTRDCLTTADRSAVERALANHWWVSQLLALRDVPRTPRRLVSTVKQLENFTNEHGHPVVLLKDSRRWHGPHAHLRSLQEANELTSLTERMWVQDRPEGLRVRVMATRERSLALMTRHTDHSFTDAELSTASYAAIQAVRAIPELRWASVDLLLHPRRIRHDRDRGALVEGLSISPAFTTADHVVAGDMDDFFTWILLGSEAPTANESKSTAASSATQHSSKNPIPTRQGN